MAKITITIEDKNNGVEVGAEGFESEEASTSAEFLAASLLGALDSINKQAEGAESNDKG